MLPNEFIKKMIELCKPLSLSIPVSTTIAQAALESGWGDSGLTTAGNALFGIKAGNDWTGKKYNATTQEVIDGTTITTTATFRAYDSWGQSIIDHDDFLRKNPRYKKVLDAADGLTACDELQNAGYATDPNYARKLKSIIRAYDLTQYDDTQQIKEKQVEILANPGETVHIVIRITSN